MFSIDKARWKLPMLATFLSCASLAQGQLFRVCCRTGWEVASSRPYIQMWEMVVAVWVCQAGLPDKPGTSRGVAGLVALWPDDSGNGISLGAGTGLHNKSHSVRRCGQMDCSSFWTLSQAHILNHCRPGSWKSDLALVWVGVPVTAFGQSIPLSEPMAMLS